MLPTNLTFVDIETTGGRTSYDRIIEVGIVRMIEGEITDTYSTLINPQTHLPPEIVRLTGITPDQLTTAPTFREVADDILQFLEDSIFVAHNVRFDYGFLKTEFKRLEKSFSKKHFCTVRLSRALFPKERRHNLDSLIERFDLAMGNRHRALDDAKAIASFYTKAKQLVPQEAFESALKTVLKKPYLPVKLSGETLDALPETPGVYIFYGSEPDPISGETACEQSETRVDSITKKTNKAIPLYIGKSINIKERVLSHFSGDIHSPLEMKIAQQVESIETISTAGELGALFLESHMIKEQLPLFNRKLRRKRELVALKQTTDQNGYLSLILTVLSETPVHELSTFLGFFNSRKQAQTYLTKVVKEHTLCEKLTGLEKTTSSCFGYRLERCKGACIAKESPLAYNIRFQEAFSQNRIRPWPYPGTIVIEEPNILTDTTDYFLVDKWCFLGKTTIDTRGSIKTDPKEYSFDLDTYKILKQYIFSAKNQHRIKILPGDMGTTDQTSSNSHIQILSHS